MFLSGTLGGSKGMTFLLTLLKASMQVLFPVNVIRINPNKNSRLLFSAVYLIGSSWRLTTGLTRMVSISLLLRREVSLGSFHTIFILNIS